MSVVLELDFQHDAIRCIPGHLPKNRLSDCILMQYTGLKDKNGKEIYENDYLQWGHEVMCVFWGSGKYVLQNISIGDIIDCNENTTSVREVIGNRFETPREHPTMETDL